MSLDPVTTAAHAVPTQKSPKDHVFTRIDFTTFELGYAQALLKCMVLVEK